MVCGACEIAQGELLLAVFLLYPRLRHARAPDNAGGHAMIHDTLQL